MLAGSVAVVAVPVSPVPASFPLQPGGPRRDTELLQRIAAVYDRLAAYRQSDAAFAELQRNLRDHPDFPDHMPSTRAEGERWDRLMERAGITTAEARCERLYERYEAALAAAFALPARSLVGVHGKLQLAVTAVKHEQSGLRDPADCGYLDNTLGDLGRLTV